MSEMRSVPQGTDVDPSTHAVIGFDPVLAELRVAPVREYACADHPERRVHSQPKPVKDQAGCVVGYHYPVADGPFCLDCGRLMTRVDPVTP